MRYKEVKEDFDNKVWALDFMDWLNKDWFVKIIKLKKDHQKVYQVGGWMFLDEENYNLFNRYLRDFESILRNKILEWDKDFVKEMLILENDKGFLKDILGSLLDKAYVLVWS